MPKGKRLIQIDHLIIIIWIRAHIKPLPLLGERFSVAYVYTIINDN